VFALGLPQVVKEEAKPFHLRAKKVVMRQIMPPPDPQGEFEFLPQTAAFFAFGSFYFFGASRLAPLANRPEPISRVLAGTEILAMADTYISAQEAARRTGLSTVRSRNAAT
jgi:hypothetical protein